MEIPKDVTRLTKLFAKLGANDPESWAQSQVNEGFPQLQRFLFLRQAWGKILPETNTTWINQEIKMAERHPSGPYSGIGAALKRALAKGVARQDLTDIARGIQVQMLFHICYLLEDPAFSEAELETLSWGLFQTDSEGNPTIRIDSLHESVLQTDPTGREMRPKGSDDA